MRTAERLGEKIRFLMNGISRILSVKSIYSMYALMLSYSEYAGYRFRPNFGFGYALVFGVPVYVL